MSKNVDLSIQGTGAKYVFGLLNRVTLQRKVDYKKSHGNRER